MIKNINFKTIGKRYEDFLKFSPFLLPYWRMKLITILLNSALVPLSLVVPYLTKLIIDKAYGNKDLGLFIRLVIFVAGIFIATTIIEALANYLEGKLRLKVNFDINNRIFQHLTKLSLGFFQDKSSGEHLYKINFDSERLTDLLTEIPPQFILLAGRFLFILAIVFYINWEVALLCILLSPLLYLESKYFIAKREDILQKQIKVSQNIFVRITEVFNHIHLVKAFGKEGFEIKDFLERLLKKMDLALQDIRMQLYSNFTGNSLRRFVLGLVSVYSGFQIIKGEMSLGSLAAIMIYFTQLIQIQSSLNSLFEQLVFDFVSGDRITEIFKRQPDILEEPDAVEVDLASADIVFDNVTFGYKEEMAVLKDLSFSIKHGSAIALVGPSGCGKTTLINLLLRLYEVQKGKILIDGHNIKEIKLVCLRSQIAVALQDPFLWNDTIINNIRYAKEDASFEEIKESARLCQLDDFIGSLPKGFDTVIGEMASKISEGQKQRIALARAIVKRPDLLILDEAMSSLDSNTEEKVIKNLKGEFSASTIIIVSHRLSTVKNMDLVYFLEAPNKMEISQHTELLEKNPRYRALFASQIESERSYRI